MTATAAARVRPFKLKVGSVPDVIEWSETPGAASTPQYLGGVDAANCQYTANQTYLNRSTPTCKGFCRVVALVASNRAATRTHHPDPEPEYAYPRPSRRRLLIVNAALGATLVLGLAVGCSTASPVGRTQSTTA
jgi:hypothetical protein